MLDPIVKVKNLKVIYNEGKSNEVRSLDDVSVEIFPGEYVIVYGPSGCGKSTLLYSILGLQQPTSGNIRVAGMDISNMTKNKITEFHRYYIGIVFQAFYLITSVNILDNICLPKIFCGEDKKIREKQGLSLLDRFGIIEQKDKFPNQLSGGQKQRAAIARSLINNPQVILADEPVGNLDSESAENVLKIFKELNEIDKKTIILVTHNAEHLHFADRIIYMKDGKIVSEEVKKEKRPDEFVKADVKEEPQIVSSELKLLLRMFKNFSPRQVGALLIPYKAKQVISYVLSELTEEQLSRAESFLKELLFKNIDVDEFNKNLDLEFEKGGANWNKTRAQNFSLRIEKILEQSKLISENSDNTPRKLFDYLVEFFKFKLSLEASNRMVAFLKMRLESKIDCFDLQKRLDAPFYLGGVGLYKNTAEKIVKEVEIIMLLKYSG